MPAYVTIRPARKGDKSQIIPLAVELFAANVDPINRPLVANYPMIIAQSWTKVNFRKSIVLVAEIGSAIVGYVKGAMHASGPMYPYPKLVFVEELIVHDAQRRQGIGRSLLAAFEKQVGGKADRVFLSTDAHVTAKIFYEKVGYHVNAYRMQKMIH